MTLTPGLLLLLGSGLLVGVVSALVPVVPVEAYVVSAGLGHPGPVALAAAAAAALGQTVGKVAIFSSARGAGRSRWWDRVLRHRTADRRGTRTPRRLGLVLARANRAGLRTLSGRSGPLVVVVSGAGGVPPLLAVAVYAGASDMRRRVFAAACLLGRLLRFAGLAVGVTAL